MTDSLPPPAPRPPLDPDEMAQLGVANVRRVEIQLPFDVSAPVEFVLPIGPDETATYYGPPVLPLAKLAELATIADKAKSAPGAGLGEQLEVIAHIFDDVLLPDSAVAFAHDLRTRLGAGHLVGLLRAVLSAYAARPTTESSGQ